MHILILSQYFWPESFRINTFTESLRRAGAEVTVLTGQPNYPDGRVFVGYRAHSICREAFASGVDVFRVPIVPRGDGSAVRLAINYVSFVLSAALFGPWLLRGRKIDVIFVYAPSPIVQVVPAVLLKSVKRARLVTWVQDLWPESLASTGFVRSRATLALVDQLVRWIYRRNDLLLGQSHAFVTAMRPKAGHGRVEYFPNPGEAIAKGAESHGEAALELPSGFNVVFAGNLGTVQSLDTVLGAAERLRESRRVRLVLIGSGSRSQWLQEEVARRRLENVMIAGRYPSSMMPAIFAQASALLVSLSRSEILSQTIPAKVQTYLAAGRPIIGSLDGEGADLIVKAGAGLVAPAEDVVGLADCIRRLEEMSDGERERMGAAARTFYDQHFQPDLLAERLIRTFRGLLP